MRALISAHDVASEVQMQSVLHHGSFLLVEGETDLRLLQRFVDESACMPIPAHCKRNAVQASEILARRGFARALCVVDADFWHLEGTKPTLRSVLLTDTHDIETMILSSSALDHVLREFMSKERFKKAAEGIKKGMIEGGIVIGCLRWLSEPSQARLGLTFKQLEYDRFVDPRTLHVDLDLLLGEVASISHAMMPPLVTLQTKVNQLLQKRHDPWQLCCGHDLVNLLFIGLTEAHGGRRSRDLTLDVFDSTCRLAYDYRLFAKTRLYRSIRRWESTNRPLKVLHSTPA